MAEAPAYSSSDLETRLAGYEQQLQTLQQALEAETAERKRLEQQIRDAAHRDHAQRNLDKDRDDFIALISHELRTPITTIKAASQIGLRNLRKSGDGDERIIRLFTTINEQSDRMTRLIDDLLEVSRLQANALSLQIEQVDLCRLVETVIDNQEPTAPGFVITTTLPHSPLYVQTDRHRVEQAVVNLLQNAIKYSGSSRQVEIGMEVHDGEAVVSVRDYGVGIPIDEQPRVFERFFRARNADSQNSKGLGLGLSIAHGIVSRLGGRMWLRSAEGEGSSFYFTLPLVDGAKSVQNNNTEYA